MWSSQHDCTPTIAPANNILNNSVNPTCMLQTPLSDTITLAYFHMVDNCPVLSDKLKRLTKVVTIINVANLRNFSSILSPLY